MLQKYLSDYSTMPTCTGDTYWQGKCLEQLAEYMTVAKQIGDTDDAAKMQATLETSLTDWYTYTTGEKQDFFARYPTWGALVGAEGRGLRVLADTVSAVRVDSALSAAALMRHAVVRAVHHARYRRAFGGPLLDKPLVQNVLADLALESEAATVLALRLAAAVDAGEAELLGEGADCPRGGPGVRPAGVGDDLHALLHTGGESAA